MGSPEHHSFHRVTSQWCYLAYSRACPASAIFRIAHAAQGIDNSQAPAYRLRASASDGSHGVPAAAGCF
jgi:hypothetical protein